MANVSAEYSTTYFNDPKKSHEENMNEIFENLRESLRGVVSYRIQVLVEVGTGDLTSVEEMTEFVKTIAQEAESMENSKLVPAGIDNRGKTLFQRIEDVPETDAKQRNS